MRSVLTIFGIAIVALIISVLVQDSKQLSPAPQDDYARMKEKEQQEAWKKAEAERRKKEKTASREFKPNREGVVTLVMTVGGRGDITLELYPKEAPKTVEQFRRLAKSGFYDNIKFHRVVPDFVVQAGDPDTKTMSVAEVAGMSDQQKHALGIGAGGSGTPIPFEVNKLAHVRGSVAMALNSPRSNTGDSQFFINLKDNVGLNEDYCVFGKVVKGMEVVDKIKQGDPIVAIKEVPGA